MKKLPQRTLEYNIGLVKYQNPKQKDCFDLATIHSLLIDQNPKFIQLCQLVLDYNSRQTNRQINRPHLQRPFIEKLYKMLSQLTRITHTQNQLQFLNKIYHWAFLEKSEGPYDKNNSKWDNNSNNQKQRPGTASTKTRPYSAYTKKSRPDSGVPTKQATGSKNSIQNQKINKKVIEKYQNVDFKALKHGEKQFFLGYRTMHPEEQKPKVRLKQYQRKVFYDEADEEEKFKQFKEQKKQIFIQPSFKQVQVEEPIEQPPPVEQLKQEPNNLQANNNGQPPIQGQEGQEGQQIAIPGQEEANAEDMAGGEQDQGGAAQEEEPQPVDKLKPRVKVYGNIPQPIGHSEIPMYHDGLNKQFQQRNKLAKQVGEDEVMIEMMQVWAAAKNRIKVQQRRRAQSARITTKSTGVTFDKYKKKQQQNEDGGAKIFDLSEPNIVSLKTDTRPLTAFPGPSKRVYNQSIQNAITTGELNKHITFQKSDGIADDTERLCTFAAKPKKKTFEQILRQAEQKVNQETLQQIEQVKQKLSNNRIALGANKIFKSLSHHEPEVYDGQFVGQITGKGMMNNPFFKVAKKKKKKKKK